jgi:hypothetical protein
MSSPATTDQSLPDERFVHRPADPPPYWQESCYFVAHRPDRPGDVLILTLTSQPTRGVMECLQMGRVDGRLSFARVSRPLASHPATTAVGPARVDVIRPYEEVRLTLFPAATAVAFDLTWTARTRPHLLPPGSLSIGDRLVWAQQHVVQSGWFDGWYSVSGERRPVQRWWGQRDHSWGVRDHARAPMWMWLAIQLDDGMLAVWCWERSDGTRAYGEGCWAPIGTGAPIPVTGFRHRLRWTDADGRPVGYGRAGGDVRGLSGRVEFHLADGRRVGVQGAGTWNARYGRRGGGQHHLAVVTDDGRHGTAVYEVTGSDHHHFFPRTSR